MSTVFINLFEDSTVKEGGMRSDWVRCLAECRELSLTHSMRVSCVPLRFYRQRNSPVETLLKMYDKNILWHVSTKCNMNFRLDFPHLLSLDLCTYRANKKEVFGHKLWTLSNKTNSYCGSGIPGSALWGRSSKVSEYLQCYFWLFWHLSFGKWLDVFLWLALT